MNDYGASHDFSKHRRKKEKKEESMGIYHFRAHGNTQNYIEAIRERLNIDKNNGGLYENWDNTSILLNQIVKKAYGAYLQEDAIKKAKNAMK